MECLGEVFWFFEQNHTDAAVMWFREDAVMSCSRCGVMTFHAVCSSLSVLFYLAAGHGV